MPVHFTCPHCGQLLSVTRRKVGQPVQCVRCQGGVLVPPPTEFDGPVDSPVDTPVEDPVGGDDASPSNTPLLHQDMPAVSAAPRKPFSPSTLEISRAAVYTVGGLIAGVAIVSFLLGWSLGSELRGTSRQASSPIRRISGRITYATRHGKVASDAEAVVAIFPIHKRPDEKLDATLMRPNLAPASVPSTLVGAVRSLGGDFTRTDRNGSFEVEVASPGEYYLLVISNHVARSQEQPTTREIVEIGQFVSRATELLANNDYVWTKQLVTKSLSYEHQFGRE